MNEVVVLGLWGVMMTHLVHLEDSKKDTGESPSLLYPSDVVKALF